MSTARTRPNEFQDLVRYRIMDVILAARPYDKFVLEEAGELSERLFGEFRNLDLHYPPGLTGVSTGAEAIALAREGGGSKMIVTTPRVRDMDALELATWARVEAPGVPIVLLAWDSRELAHWTRRLPGSGIERAFLWQGDAQILVAIVKSVEDRRNVERDVQRGVQVILVIEDLVRNWSSFLPRMYQVLLDTSQRVVREGLNQSQKILRMRARPKILLCTSYEEAEEAYRAYHGNVMGIVSDVEFPRGGVDRPLAGAEFARMVRAEHPDVPILLHSSHAEYAGLAHELGVGFLPKGSPTMLDHLEHVMLEVFGFGDFTFTTPDGREVARASNLGELQRALATVPEESLLFHARGNHFSRWLKARTEFSLAQKLRPLTVGDFRDLEALRQGLLAAIADYRRECGQLVVAEFDHQSFDFGSDFYRLGGGSIGGKARGVAFVRRLLGENELRRRFPGVVLGISETVVIGTHVFDEFLDENELRSFALECPDDDQIRARFEAASAPAGLRADLATFLERATWPLAVRSSSLLEDSQHRPFTGVYETLMLRNAGTPEERLAALLRAIQLVYASTFYQKSKRYMAATPYRLEEEKMAVMLQRVIGARHGPRYYPDFSGVVRSHNFYPVAPMQAADGIAAVALGLGRAVMAEGTSLRFSPRHPHFLPELSSVEDFLTSTQRSFWALPPIGGDEDELREAEYGLEVAEEDGVLDALASTYSAENDAIYDGTARAGQRLVTFAPVLKLGLFPLAEILELLMQVGEEGMGSPVEIEFAVNRAREPGEPAEFSVLQMRPMALLSEAEQVDLGPIDPGRALVFSERVLGNGRIEDVHDLVVVDFQRFERARSREAATEIGRLNAQLLAATRPYVLIAVGRVGSRDPWLGIPVTWDQVSGARVIVEAGLRDLTVVPSQGTHFFQNLTAFQVGYFTVNPDLDEGTVDWAWLDAQAAESECDHVRHLRLERPLAITMNGRTGQGLIQKPASEGPSS